MNPALILSRALAPTLPASPPSPEPAGWPAAELVAPRQALGVGSRVSEFRILRVLGSGGFGIVYLAHDESLGRQVAVKEYMPALWARRGEDGEVIVRDSAFVEAFETGLASFVNEAHLLARFDHPSLVKVHRFWQARGTAYMVMPYYQGVSLRHLRHTMDDPPEAAWLHRLLEGLLGALEVMHDASVFHRDVAPDNILLQPSGVPVLLDFGAARHVLRGQTQALTAILKPSYAPIEQYATDAAVRQGPWTDIYAVAATLHFALTGKAPPSAAARAVHDLHRPLSTRPEFNATGAAPPYDHAWLAALDWGLAVMPQARPQSIASWRAALAGRVPVPAPSARRSWVRSRLEPGLWVLAGLAGVALAWALWSGQVEPTVEATHALAEPATAARMTAAAAMPVSPAGRSAPVSVTEPAPDAASSSASVPAVVGVRSAAAGTAQPGGKPLRAQKKARPTWTTTPQQLCAKAGWFSRWGCLRRTCATPKWSRHPQCRMDERLS